MTEPPRRRWLLLEVVDRAGAPEPLHRWAERALSRRGVGWEDVECVARVREAGVADPPAYAQWLVAVHAPEVRAGELLVEGRGWSSGGLAAGGDHDTPGGSRVEMSFDVYERVDSYVPD